MDTYTNKFLDWFFTSSVDPDKWALSARSVTQAAALYAVQAMTTSCALGLFCINVDSGMVSEAIGIASTTALFIAYGILFMRGIYGLGRKIYYTVTPQQPVAK